MFGKNEPENEENIDDLQKESFDNLKGTLSTAETNPLATQNESFGDPKGALLKRIEDLEKTVKDLDERLKQSEQRVEQLLSGSQPTPSTPAEAPIEAPKSGQTLYLSAPTPDGVFTDFDDKEHTGKSIYKLQSDNGQTGTFAVLNTIDAVSTALISLSQFIKPACKIESTTGGVPSKILTIVEGEAAFNGEAWVVRRKAVIRLEK